LGASLGGAGDFLGKEETVNRVLALALVVVAGGAAQPLGQDQVSQAVARGKLYSCRADFLKDGLKSKKIKIDGAMARDGVSKYVTFYDDRDVIAAAAAEANQKMRDLSPVDIASIPHSGLLFANVEIHARGLIPTKRMAQRYMDGNAHLVLEIGDGVIQPVKIGTYPTPPKTECYNTMYLWSVFGNYNFSVGGLVPIAIPCGSVGPNKIAIEFAFALDEEQRRAKKAEVILLDGDGKRHSAEFDLATLAGAI
jgi:hypothetical protein